MIIVAIDANENTMVVNLHHEIIGMTVVIKLSLAVIVLVMFAKRLVDKIVNTFPLIFAIAWILVVYLYTAVE